jgi:hairy and enhancer of split, invertebrate
LKEKKMKNIDYEMAYANIVDETVVLKNQLQKQQQCTMEPVSRTYQYRKVMKPMLERKRRARINRCLDELKDLMVTALQAEGENVSKLEKADILELTVRHLHKLKRQQRLIANPVIESDRFRAGFTHAANEVSRCLAGIQGVDIQLGTKLMTHLGHRLNEFEKVSPLSVHVGQPMYSPPTSPASSTCSDAHMHYSLPLTPASSRCSQTNSPAPMDCTQTAGLLKVVHHQTHVVPSEPVWRPW